MPTEPPAVEATDVIHVLQQECADLRYKNIVLELQLRQLLQDNPDAA